jgi:hypothetical protein
MVLSYQDNFGDMWILEKRIRVSAIVKLAPANKETAGTNCQLNFLLAFQL